MEKRPPWLVAMVCGELLLQLPFIFVAIYAYATKKKWIRIPALVSEGSHRACGGVLAVRVALHACGGGRICFALAALALNEYA
eukprot:362854-Chlamydomonas_euryale.AAC.8